MKKTLTINLNSIVFHIDDDAYEVLHKYLTEIADHFKLDEEKTEIMNDIEARIAELFTEKLQKSKNVVSLNDVQEIIEIMGNPSQYSDEEEPTKQASDNKTDKKSPNPRRYYRDPENATLGGIAAGLAAYFNWDVTIIRIVLVILAFISSGTFIFIYIIMWLVAPQAVTASQRLEMQGEDVTINNIKTELNNAKNYVESDKFKQSANSIGDKMLDIIRIAFKVLAGFIGGVLGLVGVVLLAVLIFILALLIFDPGFYNTLSPNMGSLSTVLTSENAVLIFVSLILVIGCPIFMLFYWSIRIASGRKNGSSKTTSLIILILWLAGLFMFYSVSAKSAFKLNSLYENNQLLDIDIDHSVIIEETRICDKFNSIEVFGNIELELKQDTLPSVLVQSHTNFLPKVITKVENGVLKIYTNGLSFNKDVKVTIAADTLKSIVAKGCAKVISNGLFNSTDLNIEVAGASKIDMELNVFNNLNIEVDAASEATLKGNAKNMKLKAVAASNVDASNFTVQNISVSAKGASDVNVYATTSLDARAYNASDVKYKGNPQKITKIAVGGSNVEVE